VTIPFSSILSSFFPSSSSHLPVEEFFSATSPTFSSLIASSRSFRYGHPPPPQEEAYSSFILPCYAALPFDALFLRPPSPGNTCGPMRVVLMGVAQRPLNCLHMFPCAALSGIDVLVFPVFPNTARRACGFSPVRTRLLSQPGVPVGPALQPSKTRKIQCRQEKGGSRTIKRGFGWPVYPPRPSSNGQMCSKKVQTSISHPRGYNAGPFSEMFGHSPLKSGLARSR